MELFDYPVNSSKNWLPKDGTVHYYGQIMDMETANRYYEKLLAAIEWRHDEAVIFGKHIVTKRKVAWYGENPLNTPIRIQQSAHYRGQKSCWN